ncbi:SMP-30/gluconolactonase/LRE family protein [Eudoraea chungangensis]|uniref:SMP-30/gluconolactonase/LRE family protein n=1 Tax=Eudoraea chungangensis TaxID=1481905 RepID=UPI0023EA8380|nr:SMP-30/gluconolactonase/LRE family protein [Eudoraea chungangensis]
MYKANLVYNAQATLGEGPIWDVKQNSLYWVDIEACRLHQHQPKLNSNIFWQFEEMLGAALLTDDNSILLALEKGLALFDPKSRALHKLGVLENDDALLRFNDGKCDKDGNLWLGTMHKELAANYGSLFKISPSLEVSKELSETTISNGMAWSIENKEYYYIDTHNYEVWRFDYNPDDASIQNKAVCLTIPRDFGGPDGMCIDTEGCLWIAHWGDNCIRRWNPKSGKEIDKINVDAPHVTSCCFGGADLKTLYITTARSGLTENQLKEHPHSGGLFSCQVSVKGTAPNYFKKSF